MAIAVEIHNTTTDRRMPRQAVPVAGSFVGVPSDYLGTDVTVDVTVLE